MIRISTVNEHIERGYKLFGWCEQHGFRDVDLQELVRRGLGDRPVAALPRLVCAKCGRALQVRRSAPAPNTYGPSR